MSQRKILATLVALIACTSLCKATCPSQRDINDRNITELSNTGETTISGAVYKMIGQDKTGNHYKEKLLDTKQHLEGFLKIAKADGGATVRPNGLTTGVVSVKTPEGYCAYNISVGKKSAVIALSTNPDQVGGANPPLRPSTKAPEKF